MGDCPASFAPDPVIEAYTKDVDPTLIRDRLTRTPEKRLGDLQAVVRGLFELRQAAKRPRNDAS